MFASRTTRSMSRATRSRSAMRASENRPHGGGDRFPLTPLGIGVPATLWSERVVLARPAAFPFTPSRLEESGALHLMERRIERAFLHEELARAPALGFLENLVAVHRALAEQGENQNANGAGEELAIVVHERRP